MRKLYRFLLAGFCLFAAQGAQANASGPKEALADIAHCLHAQDTASCRRRVTTDSHELYDRFVSYGLFSCLPADPAYISQQRGDRRSLVQASFHSGGRTYYVRLVFEPEGRQWKLDIPATLQVGLGKDWRQQLNMTEQIYLMMKQQFGPQINCDMLQNLANSNRQN